jgi:hypothetical protein
MTNEKRQYLIF